MPELKVWEGDLPGNPVAAPKQAAASRSLRRASDTPLAGKTASAFARPNCHDPNLSVCEAQGLEAPDHRQKAAMQLRAYAMV